MSQFEPPIHWNDHEDIAQKLYEKFGDDFTESKIYRVRFTDLLEWVLSLPHFEGKKEVRVALGRMGLENLCKRSQLLVYPTR